MYEFAYITPRLILSKCARTLSRSAGMLPTGAVLAPPSRRVRHRGMGKHRTSSDTPGDFDIYVLAQTWAPQFCCTKSDRCTTVSWAYSARHLSLHGLWPAYSVPCDKGADRPSPSPTDCAVKASLVFDQLPREYIDLAPAFTKWNNELHRAEVGKLARHEWQKHGTCSGLDPPQYFEEALRAMQAPPLALAFLP
jgi:ribonuclease I